MNKSSFVKISLQCRCAPLEMVFPIINTLFCTGFDNSKSYNYIVGFKSAQGKIIYMWAGGGGGIGCITYENIIFF